MSCRLLIMQSAKYALKNWFLRFSTTLGPLFPEDRPKSQLTRNDTSPISAPPASEGDHYFWARWFFIRILAVGHLAAFLSLSSQIHGLIGPHGVLPASEVIQSIANQYAGLGRYLALPTLFWFGSTDFALTLFLAAGFVFSILALCNVWPKLTLLMCWLLYLSFVTVARNFSGFQSDGLMLEATLLACLIAPRGLWPGLGKHAPLSKLGLFMMKWFLFRLMFESGFAKFFSSDPSWRTLHAMDEYYENCPFPTWIGYYVQHLPQMFHAATAAMSLCVELILPFGIFLIRQIRIVTFLGWVGLQVVIILTGNYTFLNDTSIAIALFLIEDKTFHFFFQAAACDSNDGSRYEPMAQSWVMDFLRYSFLFGYIFFCGCRWIASAEITYLDANPKCIGKSVSKCQSICFVWIYDMGSFACGI